ncbi:hypothetical protein [Thermocrinis sp.]
MEEIEIRGRSLVDCMSHFAEGLHVGREFIYGGLFWTGNMDHNKNLSIIIHRLLNKEKPENVQEELNRFLSDVKYRIEGKATYRWKDLAWKNTHKCVEGKELRFSRYKKEDRIKLVSGKVISSAVDRKAGLVFLRLLGIEADVISREKVWEGRRRIVDIWESLTKDRYIKEHLRMVQRIERILSNIYADESESRKSPGLSKLFGYMAGFDFKSFGNGFFLSRARLFWREKKVEELIKEIESSKQYLWEDIKYALKKWGVEEGEFLDFLRRYENIQFLNQLRKDWKEVVMELLKGEREEVLTAFVAKESEEEAWLSYGDFLTTSQGLKLYLFYEDTLRDIVDSFIQGFMQAQSEFGRFTVNMDIQVVDKYSINSLVYKFEELKKLNMDGAIKHEESILFLLSITNFACRLKSLYDLAREKNMAVGILLLLDTDIRQENGAYSFWDYFSFIYDFFGLPVQTLNLPTIKAFTEFKDPRQVRAIYKNLIISLLKDWKTLELEFGGFTLKPGLEVYVLLEKPSVKFCYTRGDENQKGYRHFLYEVYRIQIGNKGARVEMADKRLVLTGGVDIEGERFKEWMEEQARKDNVRLCFITAGSWEDSYLMELIERSDYSDVIKRKSLLVEYEEFATAYISERAEKRCFVIYTSEFEALKHKLKIRNDRHSTAIALKPAEPPDEKRFQLSDGEPYYHSALQVFATEGPGWEKEEVYAEKKSLFLFSILALSFYESESFHTPYSKLDLWQKRKTSYLEIRRGYGDYRFPINSILYELLYLVSKVPKKEELNF